MKLRLLAPCRTHLCLRTGVLSHLDPDYVAAWADVAAAWEGHPETRRWNGTPVTATFHHARGHTAPHDIEYVDIGHGSTRRSAELATLESELAAPGAADGGRKIWRAAWEATREWAEAERRRTGGGDDGDGVLRRRLDADLAHLRSVVPEGAVPFRVHLFDSTVGVLEAEIALDPAADAWRHNPGPVLDLLRVFVNAFADRLWRTLYGEYLAPLLETFASWERAAHHRHKYLRQPDPSERPDALLTGQAPPPRGRRRSSGEAPTRVLWVARCIDLSEVDDGALWQDVARRWLADVGEPREVTEELARLGVGAGDGNGDGNGDGAAERDYSLRWLHYLRRPPLGEAGGTGAARGERAAGFHEAWSIMIQAQYHYATLEVLDTNLNRIIGESYVEWATSRVSRLNARVSELMARTDLLIVGYRDWQKYLPRYQFQVLHGIMEGWDFESIVEGSERKTKLCAERIETLHKRSVERSTFVMDVALIVIGFLSFVSLFLELSQYGRDLLETEGPVDALARVFTVSTDVLLLIAVVLIVVLSLLYSFFRRKWLL